MWLFCRRVREPRLLARVVVVDAAADEELRDRSKSEICFTADAPRLVDILPLATGRRRAARSRLRIRSKGHWHVEVAIVGDVPRSLDLQPVQRLPVQTCLAAFRILGLEVRIGQSDLRRVRVDLLAIELGQVRRAKRAIIRRVDGQTRRQLVTGTKPRRERSLAAVRVRRRVLRRRRVDRQTVVVIPPVGAKPELDAQLGQRHGDRLHERAAQILIAARPDFAHEAPAVRARTARVEVDFVERALIVTEVSAHAE